MILAQPEVGYLFIFALFTCLKELRFRELKGRDTGQTVLSMQVAVTFELNGVCGVASARPPRQRVVAAPC
jgi:hypothetical protein